MANENKSYSNNGLSLGIGGKCKEILSSALDAIAARL